MNGMKICIQDKAVVVVLNCAFSWGTVLDREITDETNSNKGASNGALRVRKTLLPKAAGVYVERVRSTLGEFYRYHTSRTYATPTTGQRLMPVTFYPAYMEKYGDAKRTTESALDDLVLNFPACVQMAKRELGTAFKANDYPDAEEIVRYYTLNVRMLPVPKGDQIMNALGMGVAAEVDSYVGQIMQSAADDAKARLRKAVAHMAEKLTTKGSKIYDSMPGAINDLALVLPDIAGLTGDPELAAIVQEVRDNLVGYTGDDFRDKPEMCSAVGKQAADILKRMGG